MSQELDHKLDCPNCKTIYLKFPEEVSGESPIHCSSCGHYLGRWAELESDFAMQGGLNGAFRLDEGKILRVDQDPDQAPKLSAGIGNLSKAITPDNLEK